jgi:hypothetical protein
LDVRACITTHEPIRAQEASRSIIDIGRSAVETIKAIAIVAAYPFLVAKETRRSIGDLKP